MAYMRKESSCIGCVDNRVRIDRFFELVEERITMVAATAVSDHARIESSPQHCAGRK